MQFKKRLSRDHSIFRQGIRLLAGLPLLFMMASCATFIPGMDRTEFPDSTAEVGPVITADEALPKEQVVDDATRTEEQALSATDSDASTSDASTKPPAQEVAVPISEEEPKNDIKAESVEAIAVDEAVPATTTSSPASEPKESVVDKESIEIAIEYGKVSGNVVLTGEDGILPTAAGTMITLTPKAMVNEVQNRSAQVHVIDMEDKTYLPRYSTIHAGDRVVFVNKDNIRHNVFSLSENNAFDLGTYGAGLKRAVTLKEPGVVKIYCNIHPEMATFVAVGNQGLSVRADDRGRYHVDEVLPGTYELAIWNIRGETKRIVEVTANETLKLVDRIDTTAFKIEPHKNKFGENYSKNATLFEDEFY
ncbi:MAG: hypothetical protein AAF431_15220 [Pseudomonadota bacterium]